VKLRIITAVEGELLTGELILIPGNNEFVNPDIKNRYFEK